MWVERYTRQSSYTAGRQVGATYNILLQLTEWENIKMQRVAVLYTVCLRSAPACFPSAECKELHALLRLVGGKAVLRWHVKKQVLM